MNLKLPEIKKILKKILPIEATFTGDFIRPVLGKTAIQSIEKWRLSYLEELKLNNSKNDIGKFNTYITCLLMQRTSGNVAGRLYEHLESRVRSFNDVTNKNIDEILIIIGYSLQQRGVEIILKFKKLFLEELNSDWGRYLNKAKNDFKNNFIEDEVLNIRGVGFKVRDLALSCFLKDYPAIDFHIVDVLLRTGLLVYGYGDFNFGTNPGNKKNYLFLRNLIVKLSCESGYSPGELDRIFWHFGRTICKSRPLCEKCPIKKDCLTYKNKQ